MQIEQEEREKETRTASMRLTPRRCPQLSAFVLKAKGLSLYSGNAVQGRTTIPLPGFLHPRPDRGQMDAARHSRSPPRAHDVQGIPGIPGRHRHQHPHQPPPAPCRNRTHLPAQA